MLTALKIAKRQTGTSPGERVSPVMKMWVIRRVWGLGVWLHCGFIVVSLWFHCGFIVASFSKCVKTSIVYGNWPLLGLGVWLQCDFIDEMCSKVFVSSMKPHTHLIPTPHLTSLMKCVKRSIVYVNWPLLFVNWSLLFVNRSVLCASPQCRV